MTPEERMQERTIVETPLPEPTDDEKIVNATSKMSFNELVSNSSFGGLRDDTMGESLVEQQALGNMSEADMEKTLTTLHEGIGDTAKGIAVGPFTAAPDLLGMLYNAVPSGYMGPGMNQVREQIPFDIPESTIDLSGNPIREAIGLDPNSGFGMVGEVLGGWENILAKAPAAGAKLFAAAMKSNPDVVLGSIMGIRGASGLGDFQQVVRMTEAESRLNAGENAATVLADTGWYKGQADGKMKFIVSDKDSKVETKWMRDNLRSKTLEVGKSRSFTKPLSQVLDHPTLFKAYPQLKDVPITIHVKRMPDANGEPVFGVYHQEKADQGVQASMGSNNGMPCIEVYNNDTGDWGKTSILREVQHIIQVLEGFSEGASNAPLRQLAKDYTSVRLERQMLKDLENNIVDPFMSHDEKAEYLTDLAARYGENLNAPLVGETYNKTFEWAAGIDVDEVTSMLYDAEVVLDGLLNEATVAFSVGDQGAIAKLLESGTTPDIFDAAFYRYKAQGGEAEARINSFFENRSQEQIDRTLKLQNKTPEDYVNLIDQPLRHKSDMQRSIQHDNTTGVDNVVKSEDGRATLNMPPEHMAALMARQKKMKEAVFILTDRNSTGEMKEAARRSVGYQVNDAQAAEKIQTQMDLLEQLLDEGITIPTTDHVVKSAESVLPRHLDMLDGFNTVNVPIEGGHLGKARVNMLKNPSERELRKFQKQHDAWGFRTIRTEDGDLFVWDAYRGALHDEMVSYLGRPATTSIDYSDRATLADVIQMTKGSWWGNDL